ncbi:3'-5' exonuclease [Bombilactobacillus bombi]|uniref:3'-5' exonuclease n=1 Tax=Bombilactobacillus bombi TaxID=1303590 RepID=UPI0015E61788|nr:3'-5' exonuclease [Bombilactobacillus bombi]MBA1435217.1 exonuclease [Bombilactobacillus bombi]
MNFVAMDFETANGRGSSACSLALALVENNQITDTFYTLINPQQEFHYRNIAIHHIRPADVQQAPTFDQIWPHIKQLFNLNNLIAAHNAHFDIRVLRQTLAMYQIKAPAYQAIDTVRTSRRFYPQMPNHKLNTVAKLLNISLQHHHHALDDTIACAEILIKTSEQYGEQSIKKMTKIVS